MDRQRAEGVDVAGAARADGHPRRSYRPGGPQTLWADVLPVRHDPTRRRGSATAPDHRRGGVQRSLSHRCASAGCESARPRGWRLAGGDHHAEQRARRDRGRLPRSARRRPHRQGHRSVAKRGGAARSRNARRADAALGRGGGASAGRGTAAATGGGRPARTGRRRLEGGVRPRGAGDLGIRDRAARRGGTALRRLDYAQTGNGRPDRSRARISLPAGAWQLDRGRHLGDLAQHHRRAGPRPAGRAPRRQRRRLEGLEPMSTSSSGNLLYSDTENALRDSVRRLLADRCPPELVARAYDVDAPAPQVFSDIWRTLAAELGVAGLLVPESLGGAGASARDAAVVMEEIGRAVAPVPFLSSAVLATVALLRVGETETLSELAKGALTAALVMPLSTAPGDPVLGVSIGANGLAGQVSSVAGAGEADVLVVPVAGPDGLELHTVSRTAAGVEVLPLLALDMTRPLADVRF